MYQEPYKDCNFETCVYTTFNAHKSRHHDGKKMHSQLQFKPDILTCTEALGENVQTENESDTEETTNFQEEDLTADNTDDLERQLEHNLAALFRRM